MLALRMLGQSRVACDCLSVDAWPLGLLASPSPMSLVSVPLIIFVSTGTSDDLVLQDGTNSQGPERGGTTPMREGKGVVLSVHGRGGWDSAL